VTNVQILCTFGSSKDEAKFLALILSGVTSLLPLKREMAGWEDIPPNYFKTLAAEDVARIHREMSPADNLLGSGAEPKRRQGPMEEEAPI